MSAPRRRPERSSPKQAWVMPLIVVLASAIVVVGLVYAALHGFLFALPPR